MKRDEKKATKKPIQRKLALADRRTAKNVLSAAGGRRKRGRKPYPTIVFEEALKLAEGIMTHGGGTRVRRLTLLQLMDLNPSAQSTRDLITNSGKYRLSEGGHHAEEIALTEEGRTVVDQAASPRERRQAAFNLAIGGVEPFKHLYDLYKGKPMPSLEVMQDALQRIDEGDRKACVDIFVGNANYLGLLKTIGGVKHLLSVEDTLDELARTPGNHESDREGAVLSTNEPRAPKPHETNFEHTCFFIAPIGDDKSHDPNAQAQRRHSDTMLNQYVRRALEEHKLRVVRADEIAEAGMISKQIIEYILKSRLVVADLSYNNANVFYELCLRHVTGKPIVHLIKRGDPIPFDVGNFRTINIALDDVHETIAELDTHRAEIANYVRLALASDHSRDNPILSFFPKSWFTIGEEQGDK